MSPKCSINVLYWGTLATMWTWKTLPECKPHVSSGLFRLYCLPQILHAYIVISFSWILSIWWYSKWFCSHTWRDKMTIVANWSLNEFVHMFLHLGTLQHTWDIEQRKASSVRKLPVNFQKCLWGIHFTNIISHLLVSDMTWEDKVWLLSPW
jgi:hypothetical protein